MSRRTIQSLNLTVRSDMWLLLLAIQVVIGEQRGEGVKMGCRCFWDVNTDSYAQESFENKSIFCVAAAFGIYLY